MSRTLAPFMRRVGLPRELAGALWLGPMPGRSRPLDADLDSLAATRVNRIICLAPAEELARKSPEYGARQSGLAIPVTAFPISDFGVPDDDDGLRAIVDQAARDLTDGRNLFLHCAAGIGRTGMVGTCILIALGLTREQASAAIGAAGSGPETEAQRELVGRFGGGMRHPLTPDGGATGWP